MALLLSFFLILTHSPQVSAKDNGEDSFTQQIKDITVQVYRPDTTLSSPKLQASKSIIRGATLNPDTGLLYLLNQEGVLEIKALDSSRPWRKTPKMRAFDSSRALAYNPVNRSLYALGYNGILQIRSVDWHGNVVAASPSTRGKSPSFKLSETPAASFTFNPQFGLFYVLEPDGTMDIKQLDWDTENLSPKATPLKNPLHFKAFDIPITAIAFNQDIELLYAVDSAGFIELRKLDCDGSVLPQNPEPWKKRASFNVFTPPITALTYDRQQKLLYAVGPEGRVQFRKVDENGNILP
ncbi:MAG: hypothetical protein HY399_00820 [Elusimicrobia bacterium]|nr:hypothetical protein [Elusimicrobiota bacterium]